jgi:hypothetical protein
MCVEVGSVTLSADRLVGGVVERPTPSRKVIAQYLVRTAWALISGFKPAAKGAERVRTTGGHLMCGCELVLGDGGRHTVNRQRFPAKRWPPVAVSEAAAAGLWVVSALQLQPCGCLSSWRLDMRYPTWPHRHRSHVHAHHGGSDRRGEQGAPLARGARLVGCEHVVAGVQVAGAGLPG